MAVLEKQEGNSNSVDCTNLMSEARIIKTPWEIGVQRLSNHCADPKRCRRQVIRLRMAMQMGMDIAHDSGNTGIDLLPIIS